MPSTVVRILAYLSHINISIVTVLHDRTVLSLMNSSMLPLGAPRMILEKNLSGFW